ncbi:MAG: NAD(P)-dependent dehydrogenase (short-subunit alcohol dehydrogenase family) [Candidatus Azotimanducaceae bacterium]|jgi:NAD(P)-dependent dehydrogenase (short-subunit alcohol dehydrogenase family)
MGVLDSISPMTDSTAKTAILSPFLKGVQRMFTGKVVVVTGAAGALGQAVFAHFASQGALMVAIDYKQSLLDDAFPEQPGQHRYLAVDLTDRAACEQSITDVASDLGSIDVLCNIAGGFMMGEMVHETSDATWDFLMNLNTRSIINTASAAVPIMLEQGGGKIVNVGARAATQGFAQMGLYTASKAAVMRLTEAMAAELRVNNINVNCIMPGTIDTPRNREDMPDADFDTWVPTSQLASVVGFLASDAAIAVHGASVPVDGLS